MSGGALIDCVVTGPFIFYSVFHPEMDPPRAAPLVTSGRGRAMGRKHRGGEGHAFVAECLGRQLKSGPSCTYESNDSLLMKHVFIYICDFVDFSN